MGMNRRRPAESHALISEPSHPATLPVAQASLIVVDGNTGSKQAQEPSPALTAITRHNGTMVPDVTSAAPQATLAACREECRPHLLPPRVRGSHHRGDGSGPRFADHVSGVLAPAGSYAIRCLEDLRVQWVRSRAIRWLVMTDGSCQPSRNSLARRRRWSSSAWTTSAATPLASPTG